MSEGLITRIGRWIDTSWESKATESELHSCFNSLDNARIMDKAELEQKIHDAQIALLADIAVAVKAQADMTERIDALESMMDALGPISGKDLNDLKTRLEKIELYSGMTRKVDPTKPPVAKSAFSM